MTQMERKHAQRKNRLMARRIARLLGYNQHAGVNKPKTPTLPDMAKAVMDNVEPGDAREIHFTSTGLVASDRQGDLLGLLLRQYNKAHPDDKILSKNGSYPVCKTATIDRLVAAWNRLCQ